MQVFKLKANKVKAAAAILSATAVLWATYPAFARLDELIVENASYVSPPVMAVPAPQSLYEVKFGDTLSDIARKNGLSIDTLAAANGLLNQDKIIAGQVLKVPSNCIVHHVQPGDTLWDISRMHRVDVHLIAARNSLSNTNNIMVGQQLFIPQGIQGIESSFTFKGLVAWPLAWPLRGTITSPFGIREGRPHEGIDIAAEEGTLIRAVAPGRVIFAGPRGTYGLAVIIDHGGGVRTLYAHCSKVLVSEGNSVDSTTVIALAGNTGNSRGPHLHLEVLKDGMPQDPMLYLDQESYFG